MQVDGYLYLEGVEGECTDEDHEDWIQVGSFTYGPYVAEAQYVSSMGQSGSRVEHRPLVFTHNIDKASPKLAQYCCSGYIVPTGKFEICRSTGDTTAYMTLEMKNLRILDVYNECGPYSPEMLPIETVKLGYGAITWKYVQTDHGEGQTLGTVQASWNVMTNTATY